MKNIKLHYKFLFILVFTFITLILFNNNVFANTTVDSSNVGYLFNIVEEYFDENNLTLYDYIIDRGGVFYAFYTPNDGTRYCRIQYSSGCNRVICNKFYLFIFNDDYTYYLDGPITNLGEYGPASEIIYSSFDLIEGAQGSTVFFQLTPAPQISELEGVLAPIVAIVPTQMTLAEIIHLLPVILIIVVSCLALRKGLATLFHFLRRS